jgi:hypothetical protein
MTLTDGAPSPALNPNPAWWENAIAGTCSHGGHDWDGDPCDDADERTAMTDYRLNGFTMADARRLVGATVDITAWDDDDRTVKVTYPAATVSGIRAGTWLTIRTAGAEMTDADTGEVLGVRTAEPEWNVPFSDICRVGAAS